MTGCGVIARDPKHKTASGVPFVIIQTNSDTRRDNSKRPICLPMFCGFTTRRARVCVCVRVRVCAWVCVCAAFNCATVVGYPVIQEGRSVSPIHFPANWIIRTGKCICLILLFLRCLTTVYGARNFPGGRSGSALFAVEMQQHERPVGEKVCCA